MKFVARSLSVLLMLAFAAPAPAFAMAARPQEAPAASPAIETINWSGTLKAGGPELLIVVRLAPQAGGPLKGWLDVPAQGARDIPLADVVLSDGALQFSVPAINARYEGTLAPGGRQATGEWRQGGAAFPLSMARTGAPARLVRPQTPQAPFPYRQEEVAYTNSQDGTKLAGTLTRPQGAGPFPAVLLITGSGQQDRDETLFGHKPFWLIADYLTRRGFAVLRVDDRGIGGSTGNPATATTIDFAGDVEAGFDFLRKQPGIDPKRVGLLGHSEGGVIAPVVAARRPEVAFLVLLAASGERGDRIVNEQVRGIQRRLGKPAAEAERGVKLQEALYATLRATPDPQAAAPKLRALLAPELKDPQQLEAQVSALNSPWFRTFIDLDPQAYLARVKAPVLALNGERDTQVIASRNLPVIARVLKANGNRDVTTRVIPGANHLFQPAQTGTVEEYAAIETTMTPQALEVIATWLTTRYLKP